MSNLNIEFKQLKISEYYGTPEYNIYYVIENGKSKFLDNFQYLPEPVQKQIKSLISRMATNLDYRSPKIKHLRRYGFSEIKPKPHRFFYFRKCGNNYIFFDYLLKKTDKVADKIYKKINERKLRYEAEFEKFIS